MKRVLFLMACMIMAMSAFAQSLAGRSYNYTLSQGGGKLNITVKFTSDTKGVMESRMSYRGQSEKDTMYFTYQVDGNMIHCIDNDGNEGFYRIGNNDTLIIEDPSSGQNIVMKRVGSTSSKSSGSKSKKRR